MDISFANNNLLKYANNHQKAIQKLGPQQAKLYKQRLDDLKDVLNLEETRFLPGSYHELKENRKGQWASSLNHPYRLIFEPQEKPIPTNQAGQYLWVEIKGIEIIEIVDYH